MLAYSVIIPVYNAEKYLESCVQSVLQQNTKSEYEIVLVNDGSRDRSPELCDWFAQKDGRICVIHQQNQGVSAARNAGIAAAKGDYIIFLDSDDKLDSSMLSKLDQVVAEAPDMVEFGYVEFATERILKTEVPDSCFMKGSGLDYFNNCCKGNRMPIISCWSAAFKLQLLKKNKLQFQVGVTYGEDYCFHMHSLKSADSVVSIPEALYWYRANEESVTHTLTLKRVQDNLKSCADMYHVFPCEMLANYYCMNILKLADLSKEDAAKLNDFLKKNSDILQNISGRKAKIVCVLYKILGWYGASKLVSFGIFLKHYLGEE